MTAGLFTVLLTALAPSLTQTAVANGDTRTINLHHAHTKEYISATYLVHGQYDRAVLEQLNWFLRDWRREEPTNMDPRLFDVVWEAYRTAGATTETVNVVSAYRSPQTNAMLRSRSRAVAKYSQHMLGKAMDTTMPGMPMSRIREVGMRMQRGGVGYYPTAGTPFVHLDVGSVRAWPRMSYDQLVRLFPDGKTVHLPAGGPPLPGYEVAKAEIEARNNGAYVQTASASSVGGFLAFLFGGGEGDEDANVAPPPPQPRKQWASLAPRNFRTAQQAGAETDEEGGAVAAPPSTPGRRSRSERLARAESDLPRGETTLSAPAGEEAEQARPAPPEKIAAVRAPLPPQRPASIDKPTPLDAPASDKPEAVAALDIGVPTRGSISYVADRNADTGARPEKQEADVRATARSSATPLPPRRPSTRVAAVPAPLPPSRPSESADLDRNQTSAVGAASKPKKPRSADALANLIESTGAALAAGAKNSARQNAAKQKAAKLATTKVPQSNESAPAEKESAAAQAAHLAYAPSPRARETASPLAVRPAAAKGAGGAKAESAPAPLDRSNTRAMTTATPASRSSGASVLGSSMGALRSAARAAERSVLAPPRAAAVSGFATQGGAKPAAGKFAPGGVERAK